MNTLVLGNSARIPSGNPRIAKVNRFAVYTPAGVARKRGTAHKDVRCFSRLELLSNSRSKTRKDARFAAARGLAAFALVFALVLTGCSDGGGGGGGSGNTTTTDTRPTPPASAGTDEVGGKQGSLGDSVIQFTTDGKYTITGTTTENGTYSFNSNTGTVILKSSNTNDALVGLRYTQTAGALTLTPVLLINDVSSSLYSVELVSAEPAAYSEKGEVVYESSGSIQTSGGQAMASVSAAKSGVPDAAQGEYWVITEPYSGNNYKKANVSFRLGGAYAQWKDFAALPATPPAFSITGFPAGEEGSAILYSGAEPSSLQDLMSGISAQGQVYSGGGITWDGTPQAGTYTLFVMTGSALKKASVTLAAGGTGTVAWSAFTDQTQPGTFTITGYDGTAGAQVTARSSAGSSSYEGIGTVAAGGAVTWWFAPPDGTYYIFVKSGSDERYAQGAAIASGNGSKAWSEFISLTLTVTGYPYSSATVYACSSNPSTTAQVTSNLIAYGSINSNGVITWSSEPSGYSSYYVVIYYSGTYYKAQVSSSTSSVSWSNFSQISSASSTLTVTGYPYSSGTVYACFSNPSTTAQVSSYQIGYGSINSSGVITWSSAPSGSYSTYYIVVYYNSTYYKYISSVSSSTSSVNWSNFSEISSASSTLTVTGYPGSSATAYACSSNPTTTAQVTSYVIGAGTINSSGVITWLSAPSGYSSYYVVIQYSGTYYKAQVSSSTSSVNWSNFSEIPPPTPHDETTLTEGAWQSGSITTGGGEQWFQFQSTASQHYIHVTFGSLNDLNIQLYDSSYVEVGTQSNLWTSSTYTSKTVTSGQTYYIRVWPYSSNGSGTYSIAFNTSSTAPTN